MAMQRSRIELREKINPIDLRVETVADGDINQAILPGKWDRWFASLLR